MIKSSLTESQLSEKINSTIFFETFRLEFLQIGARSKKKKQEYPVISRLLKLLSYYLVFSQERMPGACTHHILISIKHASHRFTSPERYGFCQFTILF